MDMKSRVLMVVFYRKNGPVRNLLPAMDMNDESGWTGPFPAELSRRDPPRVILQHGAERYVFFMGRKPYNSLLSINVARDGDWWETLCRGFIEDLDDLEINVTRELDHATGEI